MLLQVIELGYYCLVGLLLALGPCGLHSYFTRLAARLLPIVFRGQFFFGSRLVENRRVRDVVSHRVVRVSGPDAIMSGLADPTP
jgi:hypothetical protein